MIDSESRGGSFTKFWRAIVKDKGRDPQTGLDALGHLAERRQCLIGQYVRGQRHRDKRRYFARHLASI